MANSTSLAWYFFPFPFLFLPTSNQWWGRSKVKGKGGGRGWDGRIASPTQWMWNWTNSRRQWRRLVSCSPLCRQRVRHDLATEKQQQTEIQQFLQWGNESDKAARWTVLVTCSCTDSWMCSHHDRRNVAVTSNYSCQLQMPNHCLSLLTGWQRITHINWITNGLKILRYLYLKFPFVILGISFYATRDIMLRQGS